MKPFFPVLALSACLATAQANPCPAANPCMISANVATDLAGTPDTRPGQSGWAGSSDWFQAFHPPAGYRVRVTRLAGDLIFYPRAKMPDGTFAGVLVGFMTSDATPSPHADWSSTGCPLYRQGATTGEAGRIPFDVDATAGGVLASDNILHWRAAIFQNTSGVQQHMEITAVITFVFEELQ